MFGIERYIEWALNGPTSFDKMISNNIDRDGLYYETTTGYTDVVRTLYLQIAEMFYSLRTPKYPQGINYYDDPRFQALYVDSRERLFVAGRLPLYGDSSVDSGGPGKVMSDPLPEPPQFAVRQAVIRRIACGFGPSSTMRRIECLSSPTTTLGGFSTLMKCPTEIPRWSGEWPATEVLGGNGHSPVEIGDDRGVFCAMEPRCNHCQR